MATSRVDFDLIGGVMREVVEAEQDLAAFYEMYVAEGCMTEHDWVVLFDSLSLEMQDEVLRRSIASGHCKAKQLPDKSWEYKLRLPVAPKKIPRGRKKKTHDQIWWEMQEAAYRQQIEGYHAVGEAVPLALMVEYLKFKRSVPRVSHLQYGNVRYLARKKEKT